MILTLSWLSSAVVAPAAFARRALQQGKKALAGQAFGKARRHLERASRHEPIREEAICLMAEASLRAGNASDALYALNSLLLEQERVEPSAKVHRSTRVRLLRGVAGCMLGRATAARRELAGISKSSATADELLAATQACLLAGDGPGAEALLEGLDDRSAKGDLDGAVGARVGICWAVLHLQSSNWGEALTALPAAEGCLPTDAEVVARIAAYCHEKRQLGGSGM